MCIIDVDKTVGCKFMFSLEYGVAHLIFFLFSHKKIGRATDTSGQWQKEQCLVPAESCFDIWIIRNELSVECLLLCVAFFMSTVLQRHMLKQPNGCAVEAQIWFIEYTTEINRSALVTAFLTSSSTLIWTQEGRLHRSCSAYSEFVRRCHDSAHKPWQNRGTRRL